MPDGKEPELMVYEDAGGLLLMRKLKGTTLYNGEIQITG